MAKPMTRAFGPIDLVRIMVAVVFLTEGVLKFLYPAELGTGRFARIGIPSPNFFGPFVGAVEIAGGLLLLTNLLTGIAAAALVIDIWVAILATKIPILLARPLGPFSLAKLDHYGLLSFLHESRTDLCMFLGCVTLIWHYGFRKRG